VGGNSRRRRVRQYGHDPTDALSSPLFCLGVLWETTTPTTPPSPLPGAVLWSLGAERAASESEWRKRLGGRLAPAAIPLRQRPHGTPCLLAFRSSLGDDDDDDEEKRRADDEERHQKGKGKPKPPSSPIAFPSPIPIGSKGMSPSSFPYSTAPRGHGGFLFVFSSSDSTDRQRRRWRRRSAEGNAYDAFRDGGRGPFSPPPFLGLAFRRGRGRRRTEEEEGEGRE